MILKNNLKIKTQARNSDSQPDAGCDLSKETTRPRPQNSLYFMFKNKRLKRLAFKIIKSKLKELVELEKKKQRDLREFEELRLFRIANAEN
jgi:hypothetical protein